MTIICPRLMYQDGHFRPDMTWATSPHLENQKPDRQIVLNTKALMPGFSNGHSHAFQRAIRGKTHGRPEGKSDFWSWRKAMYQVVERLTPEDIYSISKRAFVEMLQAGYTQVGEFHYVHHQPGGSPYEDINELSNQVIRAALDAGIRITLFRVVYLETGYRNIEPAPGQLRFMDADCDTALRAIEELMLQWRDNEMVRIGIAPHSVRAVHASDLRKIAEWRDKHGELPLHIHAAEQMAEIEETVDATRMRPIELLDSTGILTPKTTLIHGTHLSPGEQKLIGSAGTAICVCPTTEADLGDGLFQLTELMARGVPLTIGSDSQAIIDPFAEMRGLDMHERLRIQGRSPSSSPGEPPGKFLIQVATEAGYRSCGWQEHHATDDKISITLDHPALLGLSTDEISPGIAFHGDRALIRDVWVGGRQTIADGVHQLERSSQDEYIAAIERMFS